jgi:hypothetical protein
MVAPQPGGAWGHMTKRCLLVLVAAVLGCGSDDTGAYSETPGTGADGGTSGGIGSGGAPSSGGNGAAPGTSGSAGAPVRQPGTDTGVEYVIAGTTYYVDGDRGDDANPGTLEKPWQTPSHALSRVSPGDGVVFRAGIYRVGESGLTFGISGESWQKMTVFKAFADANGYERVMFSGEADRPPRIRLAGDYIRIEGLWFGGSWMNENGLSELGNEFSAYGGGRLDRGRHVVSCTFFGFNGVRVGALEHSYWHNNRFVRNGTANQFGDPPPLYFSSGHGVGEVTHAIVDKNLFVTGNGYAINGWHTWRNFIVTRNFITDHWGGFITDGVVSDAKSPAGDGRDHLLANNLFYKNKQEPWSRNGATLIAEHTHFVNNILAYAFINVDKSDQGWITLENFHVAKNAFLEATHTLLSTNANDPTTYLDLASCERCTAGAGQELARYLGRSESELDAAIGAIRTAFSRPVAELYANAGIEASFRVLSGLAMPDDSPLAGFGEPLTGTGAPLNAGPDAGNGFPSTMADFWDAFVARGLTEWGSDGKPLN